MKAEIETPETQIKAEVAQSFLKKAKGLSFRTSGKMLFKFKKDTRSKVDMMFLSKPLYLYFLDSDKTVLEIQKAEPWSLNPRTWRLYSPGKTYRYLLESFEDLGLEEGQKTRFEI